MTNQKDDQHRQNQICKKIHMIHILFSSAAPFQTFDRGGRQPETVIMETEYPIWEVLVNAPEPEGRRDCFPQFRIKMIPAGTDEYGNYRFKIQHV